MKKIKLLDMKGKLIALAMFTGLWLSAGCSKDEVEPISAGEGIFSLTVSTDPSVNPATKADGDTPIEAPALTDFKIYLLNQTGTIVSQWNNHTEVPEQVRIREGQYTLRAETTEAYTGGRFGTCRFAGEKAFTVIKGQVVGVAVVGTPADVIVTASFTEGLKNYFQDYSLTFVADNKLLSYPKGETNPAFFNPGKLSAELFLTRPDRTTMALEAANIPAANAAEYYRFSFDVGESGSGGQELLISFDDETTEVPIRIDLNGEWLPQGPPFYRLSGFESGVPIEIVEGMLPANDLTTLLTARGKIASCIISTQSPTLIAKGWPASVDLVGIDDATKTKLKEFGLKWTESLAGLNMAQIDFTGVSEYIPAGETQSLSHTFTLTATDVVGQESEPVDLVYESSIPTFEMKPNTSNTAIPTIKKENSGSPATYVVTIPSGNSKKIHFQYLDQDQNTWIDVEHTSKSATAPDYKYELKNVDWHWKEMRLRAIYGERNHYSEITQTTKNPSITLSSAYNTWTKKVVLRPSGLEKSDKYFTTADYSLELSTDDGQNYTPAADWNMYVDGAFIYINANGLTPGTNYKAKVIFDANLGHGPAFKEVAFTTEAATQLENSGFEDWTPVSYSNIYKGGREAYWFFGASVWKDNPPTTTVTSYNLPGWQTVNSKTVPENPAVKNTWYMVPSTERSGDKQGGNYSARIRNVAWHNAGAEIEKNTPVEFLGGGNEPVPPTNFKHSVGKLFLSEGYSYDHSTNVDTYNHGIPFTSRPTKLTGYYKYNPFGNGEKGIVQVFVEYRSGTRVTVLAQNTIELETAGSFTSFEVPLNYTVTQKATHLRVMFASSNKFSDDQAAEEAAYIVTNNNTSDMISTGSELWIDDVALVYEN